MPQLDPSSFASQLFWLAITFSLVYLVMVRISLPRITGVLKYRQDKIANDLDRAEQFRKEAEELRAEYEVSLKSAREKAHTAVTEALAKAKQLADQENAKLDAVISSRLQEAEARIAKQREEAETRLKSLSGELASAIVAKLTGDLDVSVAQPKKANGA